VKPPAYAATLVRLLQGPLYSDSGEAWDLLLRHRPAVEQHFSDLGLEVVLAEHDGLAFLRRRRPAEVRRAPRCRSSSCGGSCLTSRLCSAFSSWRSSTGSRHPVVTRRVSCSPRPAPGPGGSVPALQEQRGQAVRRRGGSDQQPPPLWIPEAHEGRRRGAGSHRLLKYKIDADRIAEVKARLARHAGDAGDGGDADG